MPSGGAPDGGGRMAVGIVTPACPRCGAAEFRGGPDGTHRCGACQAEGVPVNGDWAMTPVPAGRHACDRCQRWAVWLVRLVARRVTSALVDARREIPSCPAHLGEVCRSGAVLAVREVEMREEIRA